MISIQKKAHQRPRATNYRVYLEAMETRILQCRAPHWRRIGMRIFFLERAGLLMIPVYLPRNLR